jgi:hypothetical protein
MKNGGLFCLEKEYFFFDKDIESSAILAYLDLFILLK